MAMKSSEYWKKREAENAMKNQISEVQYKKDIEEIYANMMDEINKEINGFYTKFLFHWHLYDCRGVSGVCPDHVT